MAVVPHTTTRLEHLFDAELRYEPDMEPILPVDEGDGSLIGSGRGSVEGSRLNGDLSWTLFEHVGELACAMHPAAVIETKDEATIRTEGRGWALRPDAGSSKWSVGAALRFSTADERYEWLDGTLGLWEGEFDAEAGSARYRAYIQVDGDELESK